MTVKDTDMIEIQNLTNHTVVYKIDDTHRRALRGQQKIRVSAEELRQLAYSIGGAKLLRDYLRVNNRELAEEFEVEEFEAEYQWTKKDVENLLANGSMERLEDALEFAPQGIIDLIISVAINTQLNDRNKCELISKYTNRDINGMITQQKLAKRALEQDDGQGIHKMGEKRQRRVALDEKPEPKKRGRRTSTAVETAEQPSATTTVEE